MGKEGTSIHGLGRRVIEGDSFFPHCIQVSKPKPHTLCALVDSRPPLSLHPESELPEHPCAHCSYLCRGAGDIAFLLRGLGF